MDLSCVIKSQEYLEVSGMFSLFALFSHNSFHIMLVAVGIKGAILLFASEASVRYLN